VLLVTYLPFNRIHEVEEYFLRSIEDGGLGRPPLKWKEEEMPPWLNGLRSIFSLG